MVGVPSTERRNELVFIERTSFTEDRTFHVRQPGKEFPIRGPGTLLSLLIISQADTFKVYVEVDDQVVVDESFSTLDSISDELPRVSAYTRSDGDSVVSVQGYEFLHSIDAVVQPTSSTTFTRQRAEVDVVRDVFVL